MLHQFDKVKMQDVGKTSLLYVQLVICGGNALANKKENYLTEDILKQVFNHAIPICLTNTNFEIIGANKAYWVGVGRLCTKQHHALYSRQVSWK